MNPSQHTLNRARQDLRHLVSREDLDAIDSLCFEDAARRQPTNAYLYYQDAYTHMLQMYAEEIRYQVLNRCKQ